MITKFKKFDIEENIIEEGQPMVGDYVSIRINDDIVNSIGKIIRYNKYDGFPYTIQFDKDFNLSDFQGAAGNEIDVQLMEIEYWSRNKKELENILQELKYNL